MAYSYIAYAIYEYRIESLFFFDFHLNGIRHNTALGSGDKNNENKQKRIASRSLYDQRSISVIQRIFESKQSRNETSAAKPSGGEANAGPALGPRMTAQLKVLGCDFGFSIEAGELQIINANWYVTHTGLLRLARRKRCRGIHVEAVDSLCDSAANRFVLKATVYPSKDSAGFVGYGDADPSNVSPLVRGAEMRIAETRAVNRALRKAYGIGICSVEEIGSNPGPIAALPIPVSSAPKSTNGNGNGNGTGHKVRDRLCQIIRQHKLDPELVKAYAVDFCGTKALKDATREQVETFVQQLAEAAKKDRDALLCQLNSYARPNQEVAG